MRFFSTNWTGFFVAEGATKVRDGHLVILCKPENGREEFCIRIAYWILLRTNGEIVPA